MTRALVLGGGGPVGRGWQSGLLQGLAMSGLDLAAFDLVVGTSAGAVVGALLTCGLDLTPVVETALRMGTMLPLLAPSDDPRVRARLGRMAVGAAPMSEHESLNRATFAPLVEREWPAAFRASAVHAQTGELRVFGPDDGVPLVAAVAASSALPGVYPPVTVGGELYVDGGLRSPANADLAVGYDEVTVVSCLPTDARLEAQLATLRGVVLLTPGDRLRGLDLLDHASVPRAYALGHGQGVEPGATP